MRGGRQGLLLALLLLAASPLQAQSGRPLDPAHWSHDLLEILHGMGLPETELLLLRGVSGAATQRAMGGALSALRNTEGPPVSWSAPSSALEDLLLTWSRRLEQEVGSGGDGVDLADLESGALLEGELGWADHPSVPVPDPGGYGRVLLAGDPIPGVSLWGEALVSQDGSGKTIRSLGLAFPFRGIDVFLGRVPRALGQGRDPFILNGRVPVDGVGMASRVPFRLPGALEKIGSFRIHLGLSPFISTPEASSAWFGSFALSWSPHPRVDLGVLRTTRFAGEGIQPFSFGDFVRMLAWQGENDAFDDSQGEVALRVRWSLAGQSLNSYASFGFEDKGSISEDPGLLLGVLAPVLRPEALYTLRYEFLAFGSRAYWCSSCFKTHHAWYLSPSFGAYTLDGEPLGSLLGGYGASHRGRAEAWLTGAPLRGWVEYLRESRYFRNILLDPAVLPEPAAGVGSSWTVGVEAFLRGRWGLSGSVQKATLDGGRTMGGSLAIRFLTGF